MATQDYVLVVEDDDLIRLALKEYFTHVGLSVLLASDGVGAIKHLLDYPVKVIVTDYRMDTLGGDYWVRFLRRFCPEIKVLITSGFLDTAHDLEFETLAKPYSYEVLAERVRALLQA